MIDIGAEFEKFFEFPTTDRSTVSSVSCKLFARHVAEIACGKWVNITPETIIPAGRPLLAYYENDHGLGRRVRARYVPARTEVASEEYEGSDYDEEADTYYVQAGWYEFNEHEEINWMIDEEVTHFMELPPGPEQCK